MCGLPCFRTIAPKEGTLSGMTPMHWLAINNGSPFLSLEPHSLARACFS